QAEDGIRDDLVTGVQTCALPIFSSRVTQNADLVLTHDVSHRVVVAPRDRDVMLSHDVCPLVHIRCRVWIVFSTASNRDLVERIRSEERRVGKEYRTSGGAAN